MANRGGKPREMGTSSWWGNFGSILPRGVDWNKSALNRRRTAGQGCLAIYEASERSPSALRDRRGELDEEIVGGLLRRAVDETLAKLGELAADLRLHVIGEKRAAILVGQRHLGAALGKARNTPLAFAGNAIAVGRIEIGEPDLAFPARLDRADLDRGDGLKLVVRSPIELLAARDTALEHLRVVELFPHHLPGCGELHLPIHRHRHRSSPSSYRSRHGQAWRRRQVQAVC